MGQNNNNELEITGKSSGKKTATNFHIASITPKFF